MFFFPGWGGVGSACIGWGFLVARYYDDTVARSESLKSSGSLQNTYVQEIKEKDTKYWGMEKRRKQDIV